MIMYLVMQKKKLRFSSKKIPSYKNEYGNKFDEFANCNTIKFNTARR